MAEVCYRIGSDYPVLSAYMQSRAPVSIIRGPLGSGKTIGTVQRLLMQMCEAPIAPNGERKSRWLAVRNTYLDLTETTIKDFLAVFQGKVDGGPPLGDMRYGGLEPPNFHARFRIDDGTMVDAEVIFLALDRDDSIRKLKGYQVTGIWFNELSEISKSIVDMADLRLGRFSELQGGVRGAWYGWFGDTNSFDESHWLAKAEKDKPEGWEFFIQPGGVIDTGEIDERGDKVWVTNPRAENLANLPPRYYERGLVNKDPMWVRVMLANLHGFIRKGLPVYPRFSEDVHVVSLIEPNRRYPIDIGFDFGRTPACVIGQDWRHVGRYVALRSISSFNMSATLFAPEVKRCLEKDYGGFQVRAWGDPAGDSGDQATEETAIRVVRSHGIPIVAAPSNEPTLRRAALDNPLTRLCLDGRPAYRVSKAGCAELIRALNGGYHYRKLQISGAEPRYADSPEKNDDSHVAEAEEYRLLGSGEGSAALMPA
jgi:hypothetical protein